MEPKFAENIIVIVLFKKKFRWYCTDKALWKMDYLELYDDYHDLYINRGKSDLDFVKEVGSFGEFSSSRFRIRVLDRDTAKEFLKKIDKDEVSAGELAYEFLRAESDEQRRALVPSLLVDFDSRQFYSQYPEQDNFEQFVPAGWRAARQDFTPFVPAAERYWAEV